MSDESLQAADVAEVDTIVDDKATETATPDPAVDGDKQAEQDESKQDESNAEEAQSNDQEEKISKAEKTRRAMQKRIDRKTAVTKALEKKVTDLEGELKSLRESAPAVSDTPEPNQDDFDTWEDYVEAVSEHRAEKKLKDLDQKRKQEEYVEKQRQLYERQSKDFNQKIETYRQNNPDYDEASTQFTEMANDLQQRLGSNPTLQAVGQVVMGVENPPVLIHKLGQNPDMVDDLMDMTPVQAAFKLFEIYSGHSSPAKPEKPPAPIKSTKAASGGRKSLNNMSPAELQKWARSQKRY